MKNLEENEHIATIQYLSILKSQKKIIEFWATINEVKSQKKGKLDNIRIALKNKRMGKKAGVSDITIVFSHLTLYIEMKRKRKILKSGKLSKENLESDEQKAFRENINLTSSCVGFVCYGFKEAKDRILQSFEVNKRIKEEKESFPLFDRFSD